MFKFTSENEKVIRVCINYLEPGYAKISIDPRDWTCIQEEHKSTLVHEFQKWIKEDGYVIDYEASICSIEYYAIPTYVIYQHDYSYWEEEIV